jgi:hypothetical protein
MSEPATQDSSESKPLLSSFTSDSVGPIERDRHPKALGVFSQQRSASIIGPRFRWYSSPESIPCSKGIHAWSGKRLAV